MTWPGADEGFLLPPSVDEWLPERHLARFMVEVVDGLDVRAMIGAYRGAGSAALHPRMLLGVLVYGYATGVFSSRKPERATYDSVAFRFIAANDHPDHETIAAPTPHYRPSPTFLARRPSAEGHPPPSVEVGGEGANAFLAAESVMRTDGSSSR